MNIGFYTIYNSVVFLTSPVWLPILLCRYYNGKSRAGWAERWGHFGKRMDLRQDNRPRIWIHAVSAGEVVAAVPILSQIRLLLPEFEILFSVTTPAGMEMAEQQAKSFTDHLFFFPFDLPWVARRAVRKIRPAVFVSLESELWPNLLHELKRLGAKTVMVNGRITERNFRRARGAGARLFHWMLSNMDRMLVQSEADKARIKILGGEAVETRIEVLGNSKFDQEIARLSESETQELRSVLRFPVDAPIFVAGSTRSSEEETVILRAYLLMRDQVPSLCLLVAPRQVGRADELEQAMRQIGLEPVRKTNLGAASTVKHMILDTMGELANVYAVATLAFVGNSFEPVVKGGGQNLLQPLAHGKPVFFGPKTATIRSEVDLAVDAGVGFRVENAEDLARQGVRLLKDSALRADIGEHARALIDSQRGVSLRYAQEVADLARQVDGR